MRPDEFSADIYLPDWLFTVSLGAGLGLCLVAAALAFRRPTGWRAPAIMLSIGGLAVSAFTGSTAADPVPWNVVDLQLKPYLGAVAETAAMVGALVLGAAVTAACSFLLLLVANRRRLPPVVASAGSLLLAGGILAAFLPIVDREASAPRHPDGTTTANVVASRAVLEGLDIPTGLDIAPNGDMLLVELPGRRAVLASPGGAGGYSVALEVPLGLAEGNFAFHGAFHPEYPAVRLAYVVTQVGDAGGRTLQVLEVALDGSGAVRPVISGLPTTQRDSSQHHGSGIAFCGEYLYVTTSDGDSLEGATNPGTQRWAQIARAQLPASGYGQVMRWRLAGDDLLPDGVFTSEFPSFAMGFRNPFGINCDEATGFPLVADNGERGFDQVRLVQPGSNHGWPVTRERIEVVAPWFDSGKARIAPTGVVQRPASPEFLVLSTFSSEALYELAIDREAGTTAGIRLLREVEGGAYAVDIGPDGCVYYTDIARVYRLQESGCE